MGYHDATKETNQNLVNIEVNQLVKLIKFKGSFKRKQHQHHLTREDKFDIVWRFKKYNAQNCPKGSINIVEVSQDCTLSKYRISSTFISAGGDMD